MRGSVTLLGAMLAALLAISAGAETFGVARFAAPVLNVSGFDGVFGGKDGRTLKTDRCGQVRELEYIALPGTVFRILAEERHGSATVYRVDTEEYPTPAGGSLFVDSRFIVPRGDDHGQRARRLPDRETILERLRGAVGSPYVWGGNRRLGCAELIGMYFRGSFSPDAEQQRILAGLDCSGLLYEVTDGWTPRNTSGLVFFGRGVPVAGKRADELAEMLEPLDLIVWNGHVVIVLDRDTAIESRLECGRPGHGGVKTTPLRQRLTEIMRTRRAAEGWPKDGGHRDLFVVRRWYGM